MKVSVIIPTYNGGKTIERAINSVLNQTAKVDIEILVCDDCSTDDTTSIAESKGCIVITTGVNSGGPNKGRNLGIGYATGDYIAFLDQDDEWLPDKLEKQLKEINNGAEMVYSQCIKKLG